MEDLALGFLTSIFNTVLPSIWLKIDQVVWIAKNRQLSIFSVHRVTVSYVNTVQMLKEGDGF